MFGRSSTTCFFFGILMLNEGGWKKKILKDSEGFSQLNV